nr:MAG TPA: hypothetical protein [Caudoviricetes sp.]
MVFIVAAFDVRQHFRILLHNCFLLLIIVGFQTDCIAVVCKVGAVQIELKRRCIITADVRLLENVQRNVLRGVHSDLAALFKLFLEKILGNHSKILHLFD